MQDFDNYPPIAMPENESVLGESPVIHPTCQIRKCQIGSWVWLGPHTFLVESSFGDYSYTAGDVQIIYTKVGRYCSIANSVRINPGNHPQWRVTQHHMTYRRVRYRLDSSDDLEFFQWRKDHQCVIDHDVWIGHGAVIMPGVHIGTGAVVGSGAVVTKNLAPYEVAVGVPARVIKKRFSDEVIVRLLASQWWNWNRKELECRFRDLLDIEDFLKKY
jgi:phosphonate metabolism protein (transferase hexapeptide repeat family)